MRKFIFAAFWLVCGGVGSLSTNAHATDRQTLTFSSSGIPAFLNEEGTGLRQILAKAVFDKLGYGVTFNHGQARDALHDANNGMTDGLLLRNRAIESRFSNLIRIDASAYSVKLGAFVRDPSIKINGYGDLAKLRVGYVAGWRMFEKKVTTARSIIVAYDLNELILLLRSGSIDAFFHAQLSARYQLYLDNIHDVYAVEPALETMQGYIYLHAKHTTLAEKTEAALKAMKADGSWDRLHRQTLDGLVGQ